MTGDWKSVPLGDVCQFEKRQGIHAGLPYIGLENIESNTGRLLGDRSIDGVKSNTFRFSSEHVLYGRLRPYLNKVFVPNFEGHCSTEIFPLKPNGELIREYLFYWLISDQVCQQIDATCTGARMPRADMNEVLCFEIPLPPVSEQQRIVAILDEAFDSIATAKANAEKNLQNAGNFLGNYIGSVFSEGGERWTDTTIGDQLTLQRGFDITKGQQRDGDVPVVSSGGIKSYHDSAMVRGPGVVIGRKGTLGKCYFVAQDFWPHDTTLWVKDFKGNEPRIVYYLLSGLEVKHLDSGAANPALNRNQVHPIKIKWPPVSKQREMILQLDSLSVEMERLESIYEAKLSALEGLKKSLLHHAFSGQL